ncbi:MAG: FliH/SctL family protein [Acidobacteriota bacterium]
MSWFHEMSGSKGPERPDEPAADRAPLFRDLLGESERLRQEVGRLEEEARQLTTELKAFESERDELSSTCRELEERHEQERAEHEQRLHDERERLIEQARQDERAASEAELDARRAELAATAEQLSRLRRSVLQRVEDELRELVVLAASRLVRRELEASPELFIDVVRSCIEENLSSKRLELHVHPDRVDGLRELFPADEIEVLVATDRALGPWDFELRLDTGCVDGSLDARFAELAAELAREPLDLLPIGD